MSIEYEGRATKATQIYRKLGQGIKIFPHEHGHEHEHEFPEVDILAVPGLGANPEECWTWHDQRSAGGRAKAARHSSGDPKQRKDADTDRKFNWIRDKGGLSELFPKSRIMLYDYASAWQGNRKVRATMKNICQWLLDDLRERRRDGAAAERPLILIGHSMGGVVIAKTLCMARARREFESILTCTVGCVFFGTPFRGSNMARMALMYSSVFGRDAYESLLCFMKTEKNDALDEVTNDFMEISSKLVPPIDILCVWEQVPADFSQMIVDGTMKGGLLQHKAFKASAKAILDLGGVAFKTETHFVEKESAVLQGADSVGLTAGHSDLVKFESTASDKFIVVKSHLSRMYQMAKTNARKRVTLSGHSSMSQRTINQVREALEGVDMRLKFRTKVNQRSISSWLESVPLYQSWLVPSNSSRSTPYLWLKGGPGLGKTNATMAAIQHINKINKGKVNEMQLQNATTTSENLLAYFLCEWTPGCNTAEELLQSLITQIIDQDAALAQHGARWFVPNARCRTVADQADTADNVGASGAKATTTVDNLWRCLQDMVDDPAVNNMHLIVNNMHLLESSSSTNALLAKLRDDSEFLKGQPQSSRRVSWLLTSRNDRHINQFLNTGSISIVDLENDHEYGAAVSNAKRQHAREAVSRLRSLKGYTSDHTYYVRNSIESISADAAWIDVLCILLGDMPDDVSSLSIRKWVNEVSGYNIHQLIDHAWDAVLGRSRDSKLEIEEVLQALTIAYEPPRMADLAVLTGIEDLSRLSTLVESCSPVIELGSTGEHQGRVVFTHPQFAQRLSTTCHGRPELLDNTSKRRYHGLMAMRCFKHIQTSVKVVSSRERLAKAASQLVRSTSVKVTQHDGDVLEVTNDEEDLDESKLAAKSPSTHACPYPTKYLFRHLSEGFPDVAQELYEDDPNFWGQTSALRSAWLRGYEALTNDLKELDTHGMSALHIAAGIGAKELVSFLVSRNGASSLSWTSDNGMTALHTAAFNNHTDVVDALIRAGADVEAGEGSSGTALHQAALRGNCQVISLLIRQGANINALSRTQGPVINAAIQSGTVDAVKQIMDGDVRFDLNYTEYEAPLSLSARLSEPALFKDILETAREKWLQNAKLLDQALISASYNGRVESVRILLRFPHVYTNNTMEQAILSAAEEKKWPSINQLLDHVIDDNARGNHWQFKVDGAFFLAATTREEQLEVLNKLWHFSKHGIAQSVLDFSLYQATVLKKDTTVIWLLEACRANANATAERPEWTDPTSSGSSTDYSTALNAAASGGMTDLVRSLLQKGATIDGDSGYALPLAASQGHEAVVQLLLQFGAAVDKDVPSSEVLGFFSGTALQAACENNKIEVVKALLAHGANPNLGGGASSNPIIAATERGLPDVLDLLLQAPGLDVNVTGGSERATPLINAAAHMSTEVAKSLLEHGADVNAITSRGDNALIMAAQRGEPATVELLCSLGADVTYRSPQRGLPIQVAAQASNALCAHVLAEKMADIIETYRDKVAMDADIAKDRENAIETLEGRLAETEEELSVASKDVELHRLEKSQFESMGALQGATYESIVQQTKVIQNERIELQRQYDASKGQLGLANETIGKFKKLYEEERLTNAELRKRQGYVTLQEERNTALKMLEEQKEVSSATSEVEEQQRRHLQTQIASLEDDIRALRDNLKTVRTAAQAAREQTQMVRQEKEVLQDNITALQMHSQELKDALASVQAAASKATPVPTPNPEPPKTSDRVGAEDYFQAEEGAAIPDGLEAVLDATLTRPERNGSASSSASSLNGNASPPALPSRPQFSPLGSPRSPGTSGFRTVHGTHRPDGSLGGYRSDSSLRMRTTDSMISIRKVSTGGTLSGGNTPQSPDASKLEPRETSIEEETSGQNGPSRLQNQPARAGKNGRTYRIV